MQDLEFLGLLDSPHISAGRIPTELGLRMFVDGLLEVDLLDRVDREKLNQSLDGNENDVGDALDRVGSVLSGFNPWCISGSNTETRRAHQTYRICVAFIGQVLVVLVFANGEVENRLFTPLGQTPSALREAANFLNALAEGRTLSQLQTVVRDEIQKRRREVDNMAKTLVESGVAVWEDRGEANERLIVRGRSNLLENDAQQDDIERIKKLLTTLNVSKISQISLN